MEVSANRPTGEIWCTKVVTLFWANPRHVGGDTADPQTFPSNLLKETSDDDALSRTR